MNYEETLKAMLRGKKVRRMSWNDGSYICFNSAGDIVDENGCLFPLFLEIAKSGDWEIYEEPQEEPEMTTEKAIEFLEMAGRIIHNVSYEFTKTAKENMYLAIQAGINAIKDNEANNTHELLFNSEDIFSEELEKALSSIKKQPIELQSENKCSCNCKCTDKSGKYSDIIKELSISEDIHGKKEISIKFNLEPLLDLWNMNLTKWISTT